MMKFTEAVLQSIHAHAAREYERKCECCGLVIVSRGKQGYVPCRNRAEHNEHFVLHEEDWIAAEDAGDIVAVVHSHVGVPPNPSQADMVGIERTQLPWLIINMPTGQHTVNLPNGYKAPLIGREFSHGVLDCLTLICDYYDEVLGITLKDRNGELLKHCKRADRWWVKGYDLYRDMYAEAGFSRIPLEELRPHDVLFMRIGTATVENHGAVYIGDNKIMHHLMQRLSSRDVYGGHWRKITTMAVRHERLA